MNPGTYPVKIDYQGNLNLAASTDSSLSLKVTPTGLAFSNLTPSQAIDAGTASITLQGNVVMPTGTPTGTISITLNNVELNDVNVNADGSFKTSVATAAIPPSTTPYPIEYAYSGDKIYQAISDTTTTLTVRQTVSATVFDNLVRFPSAPVGAATVPLSGTISVPHQQGSLLQFAQASSTSPKGSVFTLDPTNVTTDDATLSVWIKTSVKSQQVILQTTAALADATVVLYTQGNQIGMNWSGYYSNASWLSTDQAAITDGQWHHIAVSFNNNHVTLFKDGVATSDTLPDVPLPARLADKNWINLGGASTSGISGFAGEIGIAKVWGKPSSAAEVKQDMFQTYSGLLPQTLQLLTVMDASAQTAVNAVNGQATTSSDAAIAVDTLPALSPAPGEKVSITINSVSQDATIGADGNFSIDYPISGLTGGTYGIVYQYKGNTYLRDAVDSNTSLTITKMAPSFSGLTSSQTVQLGGTSTVVLEGQIKAGTSVPSGSVSITINGVSQQAPIDATTGSFSSTFDISNWHAGTYPVTYAFAETATVKGVTDNTTTTITIQGVTTTTVLTPSVNQAEFGDTVTFTAKVAGQQGTPTGNVDFYVDSVKWGSAPLNGGIATYPIQTFGGVPPNTPSVQAIFTGSPGFGASTSNSVTVTITKIATTFTEVAPSQTITPGSGPTTFGGTATTLNPHTYGVSGSIKVTINGVDAQAQWQNQLQGKFTASFPTQSLPVGAYTVTYTFVENSEFAASTNATTTLTVQAQNVQTTTLLSALNPTADYGTPAGFTALVSGSGVTPTGTVTFYNGAVALGSTTLDSSGRANFSTSALPVGQYSIVAIYAGNGAGIQGSTSSAAAQTIKALASAFSDLTTSPTVDPMTSMVTLKGTISSTPKTGSVLTFTNSVADGTGGVTLPYDATGVSTDAATYSMWIKTSAKNQQMLFQADSERPYIYLMNDRLGVLWAGSDGGSGWLSADTTPVSDGLWHHIAVTFEKGKMTLYKDGVSTGESFTVSASGLGSAPINLGGSGVHVGANGGHIPSFLGQMWNPKVWTRALSASEISGSLLQTDGTQTGLQMLATFDANAGTATNLVNNAAGQIVNAAVTSATLPAYYPAPNEQISITFGTSTPQYVTVGASGSFTASLSTKGLPSGDNPIQYSYPGNAYLMASTDKSTTLTIQAAATTTTLKSSANPAAVGANVTFTATVTSTAGSPASAVVTFLDGTTTLGSGTLQPDGTATFQTTSLTAGKHNITAAYAGAGGFSSSTSTVLVQTITAGAAFSNQMIPPVTAGQPSAVFTGVLSGAGPTYPDGTQSVTVTIAPGSNQVQGTATPNPATGAFSVTINNLGSLAAGTYTVQYDYPGDATLGAAHDTSKTVTIKSAGPVDSTAQITITPNQVTLGGTVTIKAWVPTLNGVPATGSVTISEPLVPGTPILHQSNLGPDGSIQFDITASEANFLGVGTYTIAVVYAGDENYNPSNSNTQLTVQPDLSGSPDKAVLKITATTASRSGDDLTVTLKIDNTGTADALDTLLNQIVVRTLTGTGTATVSTPLPLTVGTVAAGGSVTKTLTLKVPSTVQRISLTESGTLRDLNTPSASFSLSQTLILTN